MSVRTEIMKRWFLHCLCEHETDINEFTEKMKCGNCERTWRKVDDEMELVEVVPKWIGGSNECEVNSDSTWSGQFHCSTHSVWFRKDVTAPPEICPAGKEHCRGYDEAADEVEYAWGKDGVNWMHLPDNRTARDEYGRYIVVKTACRS